MFEKTFFSFTHTEDEKGGNDRYYRLFVAPEYTPQKLPIIFTLIVILMWAITIATFAFTCYAYYLSVTR